MKSEKKYINNHRHIPTRDG